MNDVIVHLRMCIYVCVCVSTVGKSVVLVSKWVTTIPTPEDGMTKCILES